MTGSIDISNAEWCAMVSSFQVGDLVCIDISGISTGPGKVTIGSLSGPDWHPGEVIEIRADGQFVVSVPFNRDDHDVFIAPAHRLRTRTADNTCDDE